MRHFISRLRQSRGFGIQSPRLYYLIRDVIRQRGAYYYYEPLSKVYHEKCGQRRKDAPSRAECELLFRLANEYHADTLRLYGCATGIEVDYVMAARRNCRLCDAAAHSTLTVVNLHHAPVEALQGIQLRQGEVLFVYGLQRNTHHKWRQLTGRLQQCVVFDLRDVGIISYETAMYAKRYIRATY